MVEEQSPTDEEVTVAVQELMTSAEDVYALTARDIRERLESKFGVSLDSRKGFINDRIEAFLHQDEEQDEEEEEEPESDAESESKSPRKTKKSSGKRKRSADDSSKRKKAKGGPKKALTAFNFFMVQNRERIAQEHPEAGFADLSRLVAQEWSKMDAEAKKVC
jgi:hypothetical protein